MKKTTNIIKNILSELEYLRAYKAQCQKCEAWHVGKNQAQVLYKIRNCCKSAK